MNKSISITLVAIGLMVCNISMAQHEIHKKNGEILYVKIVEMGLDEVKYEDPMNKDLIISLDKAAIAKVILGEGREEDIKTGFDNPELYAGQSTRAIKLNFLSPLVNYYIEGLYEQSLGPGRSMEFSLSYIGFGSAPDRFGGFRTSHYDPATGDFTYTYVDEESARGVFVRAGYKFINTPNYLMRGMRYSHILKGGYIKPELILGTYSVDAYTENYSGVTTSKRRESATFGAFMLTGGKQWVYSDSFLVDVYLGFGYGASSADDYNGQFAFIYNNNNDVGLAVKGGLNIGLLLK